jgi:hypothetical protein
MESVGLLVDSITTGEAVDRTGVREAVLDGLGAMAVAGTT